MVTITDVARYAGVSVSTVSYALSGTRPVRAQTKARVESAMRELGYHPNSFARTLARRRNGVLALLYPMVDRGVGGTGGEFVQAIAARARELGYQLVVWPFRSGDDREVAELVDRQLADGVIVMEVADEDARVDVLEAARLPFVLIGRTARASQPSVDVDFDATLAQAVGAAGGARPRADRVREPLRGQRERRLRAERPGRSCVRQGDVGARAASGPCAV